jgi:GH25 family lysozyme M1 (1,4-beta-N-acetylmuramidase)
MLLPFPAWLTQRPLWVAAWPLVPAGKTAEDVVAGGFRPDTFGWRWTIWQYSSNGSGPRFGVESTSVDVDYFNGGTAELAALTGMQQPAEPEKALTLEERIARLEAEARKQGWSL